VANRTGDGSLPSGKQIADRYGRHERCGRLTKRAGTAGELSHHGPASPGKIGDIAGAALFLTHFEYGYIK
jgi:hypothetical protein